MSDINLIVRTADQTKKAEITVTVETKVSEVIQSAVDNWSLPSDTDYTLVNVTSGKSLVPSDTLGKAGVSDGNIIEVQPVLVAG